MAQFSNIGSHSFGGPGSMTTILPSASKPQPGAVPHSLWKMVQPSGTRACWKVFSVSLRPTLMYS